VIYGWFFFEVLEGAENITSLFSSKTLGVVCVADITLVPQHARIDLLDRVDLCFLQKLLWGPDVVDIPSMQG
jgi:hypothetical protein